MLPGRQDDSERSKEMKWPHLLAFRDVTSSSCVGQEIDAPLNILILVPNSIVPALSMKGGPTIEITTRQAG